MREGYGSRPVCVCVCVSVTTLAATMDNIISGRWTGNVQLLYVYHPRYGGSDVTVAQAQCALAPRHARNARGSLQIVL